MKTIVSPSLLSANFIDLKSDVEMINKSEADWLHMDIMDGVFVPNLLLILLLNLFICKSTLFLLNYKLFHEKFIISIEKSYFLPHIVDKD